MPDAAPPRCLRCKTAELVSVESPQEIAFFECPACHREFARNSDGTLTLRWGHLITLLLYPVIFDANPADRCESVAADFVRRQAASTARVAIQEIRLELADPSQLLRDALHCRAEEQALRDYLRCVADRMEASLARVAPDLELDSFHVDAEAVWYVLTRFHSATGEQRRGAARYLGLAAGPYFRRFRHDPDLRAALERALEEAARDADPEIAFAGRVGLDSLRK